MNEQFGVWVAILSSAAGGAAAVPRLKTGGRPE